MPIPSPEQIYAAARALLPELEEPLKSQVQALLDRAETGTSTDIELLELLSQDEATRWRLAKQLELDSPDELLGYSPLAGSFPSTPGEVYCCPVEGCETRYVIGEAGEDPGMCQKHGQRLKRCNVAEPGREM